MNTKFAIAAAFASLALSGTASAASFDVASDFGQLVFSYGTGIGNSFTAFQNTSGSCAGVSGFTCESNGSGNLGLDSLPAIGVYKGSGTASAYTFSLPSGTLFLHPGANQDAVLQFTAPTAGVYNLSATLFRLDNTTGGNGVLASLYAGGIQIGSPFTLGNTATSVALPDFAVTLSANETLQLAINNAGDVSFDSTGLRATISAVPEPATWAMMLLGFGMIGYGLRNRRQSVRVTYA